MFYEAEPTRLREQVDDCFAANDSSTALKERIIGAVVPHAGLMYSGHVAAALCRAEWMIPRVVERLVRVDRIYWVALVTHTSAGTCPR